MVPLLPPNFSARFCVFSCSSSLSTKLPPNFSALFLSSPVLSTLLPPYFLILYSLSLAASVRFPPGPDSLNFSFLSSSLSLSERFTFSLLAFFSRGLYACPFDSFASGFGGSVTAPGARAVLVGGYATGFDASTTAGFAGCSFGLVYTGAGFSGSFGGSFLGSSAACLLSGATAG